MVFVNQIRKLNYQQRNILDGSLFSKPAEILKLIKADDVNTGIEVCLDM